MRYLCVLFQMELYAKLVKQRNEISQETGFTPHSITSNKVLLDLARIRSVCSCLCFLLVHQAHHHLEHQSKLPSKLCACVCVCERESVCVRKRARESVCERESVCVWGGVMK